MRNAFLLASFVLLLVVAPASGQSTDPVMENFRAYRAALERGDQIGAEQAGAAALAASETRDGDGGRTAVLAFNLAVLRLEMGRRDDAVDPARRAHQIATAHPDVARVDPLLAQIVLGRAQIDNGRARRDLLAALQAAAGRAELAPDVYLGAADLGVALLADERHQEAVLAWGLAAEAAASTAAPVLARADALTRGAIANFYLGTGSRADGEQDEETRAHAALLEALRLIVGATPAPTPGQALSDVDRAYLTALAWHSLTHARFEAALGTGENLISEGASFNNPNECTLHLQMRQRPDYPFNQIHRLGVFAVAVRISVDDAGRIVSLDASSSAPHVPAITEAINRVSDSWQVVRRDGGPVECSMAQVLDVVINAALVN